MNFIVRCILVSILSVGFLVVGAKADAAELSVGVHTVSHHTKGSYYDYELRTRREFNNSNPGLYLQASESWDGNTANVTVGTYKNSIYRQTTYATVGFGREINSTFDIGLQIGLATGYNSGFGYKGSVVPMGGLVVTTKLTDKLNANVIFVPPVNSDTAGVVHLTLDHKF